MAEPISWLAILDIAARIAAISIANGYHTDLGLGEIVLDRGLVKEDAETAYVLIAADSIEPIDEKSGNRTTASQMTIVVEFVIPMGEGDTNPELLAHRGRADIVRALKTDLRGAEQNFRNLTVTGSLIAAESDPAGASVVIAQVTAVAGISEIKPAT